MKPVKLFVTFLGLGNLPKMPGTWGSLGAAIIYYAISLLLGPGTSLLITCLALALLFSCLTIALGGLAERIYGKKDPSQVVTDEVAGYFLSVAMLVPVAPLAAGICAFFMFRLFDIVKPPPARWIEKLKGGWGLTLDDIAAGIYACAASHAVFLFLLPGWIVQQAP